MIDKQKENQATLIKDLHNELISLKNLLGTNISNNNNIAQGGLVMAAASKPLIPAWQLEGNQDAEAESSQNEEL